MKTYNQNDTVDTTFFCQFHNKDITLTGKIFSVATSAPIIGIDFNGATIDMIEPPPTIEGYFVIYNHPRIEGTTHPARQIQQNAQMFGGKRRLQKANEDLLPYISYNDCVMSFRYFGKDETNTKFELSSLQGELSIKQLTELLEGEVNNKKNNTLPSNQYHLPPANLIVHKKPKRKSPFHL